MNRFFSERLAVWRAASEKHWIYLAVAAFMLSPAVDVVRELIFNSHQWKTPLWVWSLLLAGFICSAALLEYAVTLTERMRPIVKMQFLPDNGGLVKTREEQRGPGGLGNMPVIVVTSIQAIYVRVRVDSLGGSSPKSCAAFLTKLQKLLPSGNIVHGKLYDGMQLPWSVTNVGAGEISLAPHIPRHFDVCKVTEAGKKLELFSGAPFTLDGFFDDVAEYFFTVAVVADGRSQEMTVGLSWNGKWDQLKAV